ncbi:MAG: tRNA 5-methoxyuridine(34)/uridine 5-oxyacetic acid(34) synthase CmoB [Planctomycetota bacterium]
MLIWNRPDIVEQLLPNVQLDEIQRLRIEGQEKFKIEEYRLLRETILKLPRASELSRLKPAILNESIVKIGSELDLNAKQKDQIEKAITALAPWRKGPFEFFGRMIDSEWRSNLKWDRIAPALGELRSRRILDVGCGNGYYMMRAADGDPGVVLGLDPSISFYLAFEMFQAYLQNPVLQYELLGYQHLYVFDKAFDIALCMGILYHHRSPIEILRDLRNCLRVGGFAIIESQTIPGDGSVALFPEDRYAKARNVFFVPTRDCLVNWVRRSGFKNVEVVSHDPVTPQEQRTTSDMTWESLADFLDPEDATRTIEGYPAPYRTVIRAERKYL